MCFWLKMFHFTLPSLSKFKEDWTVWLSVSALSVLSPSCPHSYVSSRLVLTRCNQRQRAGWGKKKGGGEGEKSSLALHFLSWQRSDALYCQAKLNYSFKSSNWDNSMALYEKKRKRNVPVWLRHSLFRKSLWTAPFPNSCKILALH